MGPSEPSPSLNSLVLSQLKRPPPPPPEPELPPSPAPAPVLPSAAPQGAVPAASGEVEDGEVGGAVVITRVLKLEHMVSVCLGLCYGPCMYSGAFSVCLAWHGLSCLCKGPANSNTLRVGHVANSITDCTAICSWFRLVSSSRLVFPHGYMDTPCCSWLKNTKAGVVLLPRTGL